MEKLVGYRFYPTDEELIDHYLKHKILGNESLVKDAINEVDIYQFEPWDLIRKSRIPSDNQIWFFFSAIDYMNTNSTRVSRITSSGFWKITGNAREIKATEWPYNTIGTKRTLVFYKGRTANKEKTDWVLHEYHASFIRRHQREYVICKLKDKTGRKSSASQPLTAQDYAAIRATSEVNHQIQETLEPFYDYNGASPQNFQCRDAFVYDQNELGSEFDFIQDDQEVSNDNPEFLNENDEFVNSFLVDPDEFSLEETSDGRPHNYSLQLGHRIQVQNEFLSNRYSTINCITLVEETESSGTSETSAESLFLEGQSSDSETSEAHDELKSEFSLHGSMESEAAESDPDTGGEEQKVSEQTTHELDSNSTSSQTTVSEGKKEGCFIFLETMDISHESSRPPSIYLRNMLIGMFLFGFFLKKLLFGY